MKSKLATIGTLLALIGGTGGAIAVGSNSNGNGYGSSAATAQYVPGKHCKHGKKHGHCIKAHKKSRRHLKGVRRHRSPSFTG